MKETLQFEAQLLQLAMRFLTNVPLPGVLPESDDLRVRANKYFPIIGALLGAGAGGVYWVAHLGLPQMAALIVSVIFVVLVTGAANEEGLAATFDGLCNGSGPAHRQELMANPTLGVVGGLAVVFALGLKLSLLANVPVVTTVFVMMSGHAIALMAVVHVIATTQYAHSDGLKVAAPFITPHGYRFALGSTGIALLLATVYVGFGPVFGLALGCTFAVQLLRSQLITRLGGYNSYCLGAVWLVGEGGAYLGCTLFL